MLEEKKLEELVFSLAMRSMDFSFWSAIINRVCYVENDRAGNPHKPLNGALAKIYYMERNVELIPKRCVDMTYDIYINVKFYDRISGGINSTWHCNCWCFWILFASKSFISIINITTPLMMDSCFEFYNSVMFALSQLYAKYIIFIST